MKLSKLAFISSDLQPSAQICRYMSFAKFFDILTTDELYIPFANAFPDKFEGIPHDESAFAHAHLINALTKLSGREKPKEDEVQRCQTENDLAQLRQDLIGVSCWTKFDRESSLMWNSYSNPVDGVALVVSIESLVESMEEPSFPLLVGTTSYGTRPKETGLPTHLASFFSKRVVFSEEREIRLVADLSEMKDGLLIHRQTLLDTQNSGLTIKFDLKRAAQRIIAAPQMPRRFFEMLDTHCKSVGIAFDINQSWLSATPRVSR